MAFGFIHKSDGKSDPGRAIQIDESYELETACRSIADESGLTPREFDVLVVLAKGRSAKHIADELCIAENTAWVHIKSIYAKTRSPWKTGPHRFGRRGPCIYCPIGGIRENAGAR